MGKKKKAKTGKLRDRARLDLESTPESSGFDLRTKKRLSEAKEEPKEPKKPKKDEIKETKESKKVKKGEGRDLKAKTREDSKENRKTKKERGADSQLDSESSALNEPSSQEGDNDESQPANREEKPKARGAKEKAGLDVGPDAVLESPREDAGSTEEDGDGRGKGAKKRPRRSEEPRGRAGLESGQCSSRRHTCKTPRGQERSRSAEAEAPRSWRAGGSAEDVSTLPGAAAPASAPLGARGIHATFCRGRGVAVGLACPQLTRFPIAPHVLLR